MASGASDYGDRRHQEDAWMVAERGDATLCVVCDAMGAATSGYPAAELAISTIRAAFDSGAASDVVIAAVGDANRAILARSEAAQRREAGSDIRWYGMGTTAEVAVFVHGRAHLAHVGDGCIYRFRQGRLEPRTLAHTLVNEYRRARPDMSETELAEVPKNIIVRALGMRAELEVDRDEVETLPGDVWLLCSDGLTALVSDEAIASILVRGGAPGVITTALIDAALAVRCAPGEHKDNIAVIVHVVDE
jgi:serine/threonine protein phosphatase PrpC